MRPWDLALPVACAVSGVAWASFGAWRAGDGPARFAARSLLGGAAAFGIAVGAYDLATAAGLRVEWVALLRGDLRAAVLLALAIGGVEEAAKLAGVLLVVERGWSPRRVLGASLGVAAGFAALEAFTTLHGSGSPVALARAALGPAAHALLAIPIGIGVADALQGARRGWARIAIGLAASIALHAIADLGLALPIAGKLGYAVALLAPSLWLFARARGGLRGSPALARPPAPR